MSKTKVDELTPKEIEAIKEDRAHPENMMKFKTAKEAIKWLNEECVKSEGWNQNLLKRD